MATLLDTLTLPDDLKNLSTVELEQLASEIRHRLLAIGDACGGHLASNLGVVELSLVLHTVFSTPNDKFIWDTSHQTYVHKMLTGRLDQMMTIRQDNGLAGFANIFESPHDCFGAGHASTALSAALGFAHARDHLYEKHNVVSIIGDASLSGGMAFEALNNVGRLNSNFICILNDNDMSISRPVGSMATYMTKVRTSDMYNQAKGQFERIIDKVPKFGVPLKRKIEKTVERLRDIILDVKYGVLFEEFGFKYLGPIDGHNIPLLMASLRYAKSYNGPIMIHIQTTKGKGHFPAESDPILYHGVSPQKKGMKTSAPSFTETFGNEVIYLAKTHPNMVVITPAMKEGSGLKSYADLFPQRFFDVGIAEEHAVTFAAGMAKGGLKPILAIYSTFLQRGYDQVIHDVCLQNLPVIFALDRAGLVGEDGPTHHGVFDFSFLLSIPNMVVLAPSDSESLKDMLSWSLKQNSPISIRYPKGAAPLPLSSFARPFSGQSEVLFTPESHLGSPYYDAVFLVAGSMAWPVFSAAKLLEKEGLNCVVIDLRIIKPLDNATIAPYILKAKHIIVLEEGVGIGGVSSYLQREFSEYDISFKNWHSFALPDHFVTHGKLDTLHKTYGFTQDAIVSQTLDLIRTYNSCPI